MKYLPTLSNATNTMKLRLSLVAFLLFIFSGDLQAQSIWENDINGANPGDPLVLTPFTSGQVVDANITVSGIRRGSGINGNTGTNRYNARDWSLIGINTADYFEFTLTPNSGYRIDFASFEYTGLRSSQGPNTFSFCSSVDAYTANIGAPSAAGTTISLSAAAYQNRTTATTFRFYGYNAGAITGTFSINDFVFNGNINATCASVAITSVYPTSGPVGTQVTISAASGLAGATATFGGVAATVISSSATQLVVIIPAGATTGNLSVKNSVNCASLPVAYTIITKDVSTCEGNSSFTDLIISEIYDEVSGSGGIIELFNPTSSPINLATSLYTLRRYVDAGPSGATSPTLTGIVAPGTTFLVSADSGTTPACSGFTYSVFLGTGFNADDRIELRKNTVPVDAVVGPSELGYNVYRKPTAIGPTATFNAADWTYLLTEDCSDIGYFPPITKTAPTPTVPIVSAITCSGNTATITVSATEGRVGGLPLAYQWYVVAPGAPGTWSVLTNTGVYTGATSPVLSISSVAGFNNYQYYCRVLENAVTCYAASNAVIVKEALTTWVSPGVWNNGTPSISKNAVIDFAYNTGVSNSFSACSLTVNAGVGRSLTISPNTYVMVQNLVTNSGILTVEDDGSLIQVNNATVNATSIFVKRNVSIKKYDYVYWSVPVGSFPVTSVSSGTTANFIYDWLPTQGGTTFGIWHNVNENMVRGKGYIIRSPSVWPAIAQNFATSFNGIPNNGIINRSIARGGQQGIPYDNGNGIFVTNNDDNWNLVGNPYPSAINSKAFLDANSNIEGAIRLWTHGNLPAASPVLDPFYGNFLYNYNSNDYIVWNGTGLVSGPAGFTGNIASGQGFFVLMNDGIEDYTQSVVFNNQMRTDLTGAALNNDQFYRQAGTSADNTSNGLSPKSRIWMDLINTSGAVNRTMVGYVEGATLAKDRMFDAYGKLDGNQNFYSLIGSEIMAIQGRPLPFDETDIVSLGLHLNVAGNYKIAISATDGLFVSANSHIYIEDKLLGIIHDLRQAPYDFTSETGTFDTRFILRYTNQLLANAAFDYASEHVSVAVKNQQISIKSYLDPIKEVRVYDLLGREISKRQLVNSNEVILSDVVQRRQPLVVKIQLQNGQTLNKKILF
jgi:hypothetical protein